MSGVIEKITLYDVLGYTVPGTILISVFGYLFYLRDHINLIIQYKDFSGYFFTALLFSGYITGMMAAEVFALLSVPVRKCRWFKKGNGIEDIGYELISKALIRAGVLKDGDVVQSADQVMKYMGYMYGVVQVDSKYARLHNYASGELLCGNMALISAACAGMYAYDTKNVWNLVTGLIFMCIFLLNYHRLYWRKHFYVICWFVEKYSY